MDSSSKFLLFLVLINGFIQYLPLYLVLMAFCPRKFVHNCAQALNHMTRASDHAYQSIRSLILSGAYQPGQRMIEEELAQRVGVSRTSVRDSLRRLASDGLVRSEPSRGTFVAELSMAEIEEIFQLRATLEGHASALAALHAKPEDIEELDHICAHIDGLLRADLDNEQLFAQFQASNNQFHGVMLRASGSVRLNALAKPLIELPLVQMKNHNWPGEVSVRRSNQQHLEIIEALRARDPLLAKMRTQAHIISTRPKAMVENSQIMLGLL